MARKKIIEHSELVIKRAYQIVKKITNYFGDRFEVIDGKIYISGLYWKDWMKVHEETPEDHQNYWN